MDAPGKKNIDVTRYVALGDSITSGYTDGALSYYGQQNAYPRLISEQFKLMGGGSFKQPNVMPGSVGIGFTGNSRLVLKAKDVRSKPDDRVLAYLEPQGDFSVFSENNYLTQGPFNNMGVPAAKAISLLMPGLGNTLNGAGNYNPFFTRMASDPVKASIVSDALILQPTFFTLFIGSNDVLRFALSGGTADSITPTSGAPGIGFDESLGAIVDAMTANGAKGAIANIPDLISIPFFTIVPYNGLELDNKEVPALNDKYSQSGISFHEGKNSFVFFDSTTNPPDIRQLKEGELVICDILLDPEKELYLKGLSPIPKKYVLTNQEVEKIETSIKEYNKVIRSIANEKKMAHVDINSMVHDTGTKSTYNSSSRNLQFNKRSAFSLDGLHPNFLGQALLANEFIKAINATFGSNVPLVKIIKYKRNVVPDKPLNK